MVFRKGSVLRPKIFDLLFNDDRMFVLELCQVTASTSPSKGPPKKQWAVITRRNVPDYPPHRCDDFATRSEAIDFYKQVVIKTLRVSHGKASPDPLPTIEEYTRWIKGEGLYDPLLNPDSSEKEDH